MKPARCVVTATLIVIAGCANGHGKRGGSGATEPVARVRIELLARRAIAEDLSLYGVVVPGSEAKHVSSVPFESVVRRVHVRIGQRVDTGDLLVEVAPSPDARLSLQQARAAAAAAAETLRSVRARFEARLATQVELAAAQRDAQDGELRVRSLVTRGVAGGRALAAPGPAVVTAIHVTDGAFMPAGASLLDLDLAEHPEVRLGIEVEDIMRVSSGSTVRVRDLGLPPRIEVDAVIRAVGESVDGATRLVDVYASLPVGAGLLLRQRVSATLPIHSGPVLVLPRAALVPEPDRMVVFTVDERGRAHVHAVRVGLENGADVEVFAPDLAEGARVVVSGAPVLSDGMRVTEIGP